MHEPCLYAGGVCTFDQRGSALIEWAQCDRTCLHLACKNGHAAMVHYLIHREDAEVMVRARDEDRWNCLHFAADVGDTSMVSSLLEVGGPGLLMQKTKMCDWTPLDVAKRKDSKSAVTKLLRETKRESEKKAGKGTSWLPGSWTGWGGGGGLRNLETGTAGRVESAWVGAAFSHLSFLFAVLWGAVLPPCVGLCEGDSFVSRLKRVV